MNANIIIYALAAVAVIVISILLIPTIGILQIETVLAIMGMIIGSIMLIKAIQLAMRK